MAKKQQFDLMRYWPIAVVALGAFAGYIRLQGAVQAAEKKDIEIEKRIDKTEDNQEQLYANSVEQKVQTAQMAQKLDLIVDYIKDSKKK